MEMLWICCCSCWTKLGWSNKFWGTCSKYYLAIVWTHRIYFFNCSVIVAYIIVNLKCYIVSCELQLTFLHIDVYSTFNDSWIYNRILPNSSLFNYTKYLSWHNTFNEDLALNSYSTLDGFLLPWLQCYIFSEFVNFINDNSSIKQMQDQMVRHISTLDSHFLMLFCATDVMMILPL